eukprot:scaffold14004_cov111-Isochrysis_galbana.AAC.9
MPAPTRSAAAAAEPAAGRKVRRCEPVEPGSRCRPAGSTARRRACRSSPPCAGSAARSCPPPWCQTCGLGSGRAPNEAATAAHGQRVACRA